MPKSQKAEKPPSSIVRLTTLQTEALGIIKRLRGECKLFQVAEELAGLRVIHKLNSIQITSQICTALERKGLINVGKNSSASWRDIRIRTLIP